MDKLLVFYCDCIDDSESAIITLEMINLGYDVDNIRALEGTFAGKNWIIPPTQPKNIID